MNERSGGLGGAGVPVAAAIVLLTASLPAQQTTMQVRGVVVDVRGYGVPVAEVWVGEDSDLHGDEVLARTVADGEGVFLLPRVPQRGALRLHVRAEGLVCHHLRVSPERRDLRVTMRETLPLRGTLRDRRGDPVRGVLVWTADQEPRCEATTDQDGTFVLAAVGLGSNAVRAWVPGEGGADVQVQVGSGGAKAALVSGKHKTSPVRVMVDGYPDAAPDPIEVFVTGSFGWPPTLPRGRNPTTRWQWGNDLVHAGVVSAEPRAAGFVFVRQPPLGDDERLHRTRFRAYAEGNAPTTRYRFRVRSENGHAVRNAPFRLGAPGRRDPVQAVSDDDGVVAFDSALLPGDTAELRSADPRWVVEYPWDLPTAPPAPTIDTTMLVLQLATDNEPEVKVVASSRVAGLLLRADGQPARFEQVTLGYVADDERNLIHDLRMMTTDATGAFAFEALPPFREHLVVRCAGAASEPFSLHESGLHHTIDELRMRPPSSVEGVVRNADGSPAVGVTLGIDSGKERLFADTDLQGRYRFPDVPPGLVQLMDWRGPDGPTRLGEPVLVTAGSTTTLDRQR